MQYLLLTDWLLYSQRTVNAGVLFTDDPQLCPLLHSNTLGVTHSATRITSRLVRQLSDAFESRYTSHSGALTTDPSSSVSR